jgi:hypothetical protein
MPFRISLYLGALWGCTWAGLNSSSLARNDSRPGLGSLQMEVSESSEKKDSEGSQLSQQTVLRPNSVSADEV